MALAANREHTLKSDSANACCDQWKKKYLKVQESRNALRQAVKFLELKIEELQAANKKVCEANLETQKKLDEISARASLENEACSINSQIANPANHQGRDDSWDGNENHNLQGLLADREKEIGLLKALLEEEKRMTDSVRNNGNESVQGLIADREGEIGRLKELLEAEKRRVASERKHENEKFQGLLADREGEIGRLKDLLEEEKRRADSERKNEKLLADREKEIGRLKELLEAEKRRVVSERKNESKKFQVLLADREGEIGRMKELLEEENRRASSKRKNENENEYLQSLLADREKEIGRLKELLEAEKIRAGSEKKEAAEACKLLEEEKKKAAEMGEIARIEVEKVKEYRIQISRLEKQGNEAKAKLASEMSTFKEATKKSEAEKRNILAEKRNAELGITKANKKLEAEKQKADEEKRRADAEMVKFEEQKALAEENWSKFMKEKGLADQLSQQLKENKQMIEDLKQKIHVLSSLRKPIESAADINVKAESMEIKLLKSKLKLEKLRASHAKRKYKLAAGSQAILLNELRRLKVDFNHYIRRLDVLDASFPPVVGSIHGHKESKNILDMQYSNELLDPSFTTMDASDPLGESMQLAPPLGLSGGNFSECITGINSKLEPLVRGSNRTKLQSSAVNSSTESFSDGQLMGLQEATTVNHRKRKGMYDAVEYIEKLSSEEFYYLNDLLYRKSGKSLRGREMLPNMNNLQEKNNRDHKKRKRSHIPKVDMIPWIDKDEKRGTEEANTEVCDNANACKHTSCPASHALETTQACGEMIRNAASDFDSLISFDTVADGSYMKLLELENAANEKCYRRAMDIPLSPLPEIELHETSAAENLMNPFFEEALQEDMLSPRTDLISSPSFDVFNVEVNSNEQNFDVAEVSYNSLNNPIQARKTEIVKLVHMLTPKDTRTASLSKDGIGSSHNRFPDFCVVFSNTEDKSIISRILVATKNCINKCNLATQTGWAVSNILASLKMEDKLSQKEMVSVLFTLLLFNFTVTTTRTFGKLWDENSFRHLKSYSEHICAVLSKVETRSLLVGNDYFHELIGLIKDFLVEGKVIVFNGVHAECLSDCDMRANDFLDCVNQVSSDVASCEQLVAGSVILASVCAATDHVGFICEASYDILRLCKWDSSIVLTILHIFAYLGGNKFFELENFRLMVTVLKSLVMFLEDESLSEAPACLPSINQLHTEFCTNEKCPFLEGAESIDVVASLLLQEIKNCWLQYSRFASDSYNAGRCCDQEAVQCSINKNYDVSCCLRKCLISAPQSDALSHLSDVVSFVELVANKMSWHWTDIKLVHQLLNMLDSCAEENFAIAVIALLGQLGRIGIDVGGYEDQGVGNLRCYLSTYLCRSSSMKAGLSLQYAIATALFYLLPLDLESLFNTDINLPAYSKSVSDNAETLRKWFSGLGKDHLKSVSAILKCQFY